MNTNNDEPMKQITDALMAMMKTANDRAEAAEKNLAAFHGKIAGIFAPDANDTAIVSQPVYEEPHKAALASIKPKARGMKRFDVKYADDIFIDALDYQPQTQTELHRKLTVHGVSVGTVHNRYTKLANDPNSNVERIAGQGWRLKKPSNDNDRGKTGHTAALSRNAPKGKASKSPKMIAANDQVEPFRVITADCLEAMREMADRSVDLVVTSPPYNMLEGRTKLPAQRGGGKNKLMYGYPSWPDNLQYDEYMSWQHEVIREMWRLISDDGAIFYNHKQRSVKLKLRDPRDLVPLELREFLRPSVVWDRGSGYNFNECFFHSRHETILIIAKPKFRLNDYGRKQGDVWRIKHERSSDHAAPFPVELPRRAIASTDAKVILDPFCGSGSTGVAAMQLGRRFVGIEIDEGYAEGARQRIAAANQPIVRSAPVPRLVNGCGLKMMRELPDGSVPMVLLDLPYGYSGSNLSIDRPIDVEQFLNEARRIVTYNGSIVAFGAGLFTVDQINAQRDIYKYSLIWSKGKATQHNNSKIRPLCDHEDILVFSKANVCTLTPDDNQHFNHLAEECEKVCKHMPSLNHMGSRTSLKVGDTYSGLRNCKRSVLWFEHDHGGFHKFQKPVALLRHLIAHYSNEGDLVLDPTMGSGSTGVAAKLANRLFIGAENGFDQKQNSIFDIAEKRIAETLIVEAA